MYIPPKRTSRQNTPAGSMTDKELACWGLASVVLGVVDLCSAGRRNVVCSIHTVKRL
jgi:hypothetical protein